MKFTTIKVSLLLLVTMAFAACDSTKQTYNDVKSETKEDYSDIKDNAQDLYADTKKQMAKSLKSIDKKIQKIEIEVKEVGQGSKKTMVDKISDIKNQRAELGEMMKEFSDTSKDRYKDLKLGLKQNLESLENEVEKAVN